MNTDTKIFCEGCNVEMNEVEELFCGNFILHMLICPECGETSTLITSTLSGRQRDFFSAM